MSAESGREAETALAKALYEMMERLEPSSPAEIAWEALSANASAISIGFAFDQSSAIAP